MQHLVRLMTGIAILLSVLAGCAAPAPRTAAHDDDVRLTVLYDAFGKSPELHPDWGYAALIEYRGKRILFDTGNNGDILAHNARKLGADLTRLDFVVMSHRHGDHMGGLAHVLKVNPAAPVYAPLEGFGVFGASLPGSFYRKDPGLLPEQRYFNGAPPTRMQFGSAWPEGQFQLVEQTTEIAPGIHLIALVSDKPGTRELRELSLALETPEGLVLVVGCSHPGIDRIVAAAAHIQPNIRLIAGGLHLVVAEDAEIRRLVDILRNDYQIAAIAPGHCTGEVAFNALGKAFGVRYRYAGVGTMLHLGRSAGATPTGLPDAAELDRYHALWAQRDNHPAH